MQLIAVNIRSGFLSGLIMLLLVACSGGGDDMEAIMPQAPPMPVGTDGSFTLFDDGTALDERSQLLWDVQDYRLSVGRAPENYEAVQVWVRQRNARRYKGYDDWRLPTRAEFDAIYEPGLPARSYRDEPVGYPTAFDDGGGEWYWTGDIAEFGDPADHIHRALTYDFITGESEARYTFPSRHGEFVREETGSLRLVRDD